MAAPDTSLIAVHYAEARARLTAVVGELSLQQWDTPVPACPGWSVHDVLSHLVGTIEDAEAGRLTGPPDEEQTAEQVARHHDDDPQALLANWDELAPGFELNVAALGVWPAMFDVLSHEHDVRGALGRPGARDVDGVRLAADLLLRWCRTPVAVEVELDGDRTVIVRAEDGSSACSLGLQASSFEVLRFRLGRRSRDQVAAMEWTDDPTPVLDSLFTFGPAAHDLVE
jgi:uncharacterized protein (TIGR03083 family)